MKKSKAANCSYSSWTTTMNGSDNNGNENVSGGIYKYKYPMYYWYEPIVYSLHRYASADTLHIIHYRIGSPLFNTKTADTLDIIHYRIGSPLFNTKNAVKDERYNN